MLIFDCSFDWEHHPGVTSPVCFSVIWRYEGENIGLVWSDLISPQCINTLRTTNAGHEEKVLALKFASLSVLWNQPSSCLILWLLWAALSNATTATLAWTGTPAPWLWKRCQICLWGNFFHGWRWVSSDFPLSQSCTTYRMNTGLPHMHTVVHS